MPGVSGTHRWSAVRALPAVLAAAGLAAGILRAAQPPTAPPATQPATAPAEPPHLELSNGVIRAVVLLPDAERGFNRGSRFDWSGIIGLVEYGGHTFFGRVVKTDAGPQRRFSLGTSEEFNPTLTLATGSAGELQEGIKVGVGRLKRQTPANPKQSGKVVLERPFAWEVMHDRTSAEFAQAVSDPSGYGYRYVKRIQLAADQPAFTIHHDFRNTGSKRVELTNYCHNWLRIDGTPGGAAYRLAFPFEPRGQFKYELGGQVVGKEINFLAERKGGTFFARLEGYSSVEDNSVLVHNTQTGAAVRITGDWAPDGYNVYVTAGEVCPEPFVALKLDPGQGRQWTTRYEFQVAAPTTQPLP